MWGNSQAKDVLPSTQCWIPAQKRNLEKKAHLWGMRQCGIPLFWANPQLSGNYQTAGLAEMSMQRSKCKKITFFCWLLAVTCVRKTKSLNRVTQWFCKQFKDATNESFPQWHSWQLPITSKASSVWLHGKELIIPASKMLLDLQSTSHGSFRAVLTQS